MRSTAAIAHNYNSLLELEEADRYLNDPAMKSNITAILYIIKRYGLENYVGVRLLHKHNDVTEDEIMAEYHRFDKDGFALITKTTRTSEIIHRCVPNSWQFRNGTFIPVEFSEKSLVANSTINPEEHPDFFAEMASVLDRTGLCTVLGPSLLGSEFIEKQRPAGYSILAETTAQDDRANVLRFAKPEPMKADTVVQTHWCVSLDSTNGIVTMTCTKICPSVQDPPVHQGTYIHQQS